MQMNGLSLELASEANPEGTTTKEKFEDCKTNLTAITKKHEPALEINLNTVSTELLSLFNLIEASIGGLQEHRQLFEQCQNILGICMSLLEETKNIKSEIKKAAVKNEALIEELQVAIFDKLDEQAKKTQEGFFKN